MSSCSFLPVPPHGLVPRPQGLSPPAVEPAVLAAVTGDIGDFVTTSKGNLPGLSKCFIKYLLISVMSQSFSAYALIGHRVRARPVRGAGRDDGG